MNTRRLLESSWAAAQRRPNVDDLVERNGAVAAGKWLAMTSGNARLALESLPESGGKALVRVRELLTAVVTEESAADDGRRTGTGG